MLCSRREGEDVDDDVAEGGSGGLFEGFDVMMGCGATLELVEGLLRVADCGLRVAGIIRRWSETLGKPIISCAFLYRVRDEDMIVFVLKVEVEVWRSCRCRGRFRG